MRTYIMFLLFLGLYANISNAQSPTITVSPGAVMSINGGVVSMPGNITNNGVVNNAAGSGWAFTGQGQNIGGSSANVFSNIHFNFTGILSVAKQLTINGGANFEKGIVNMAGGSTMYFGPQATSTAVETSYVTGIVQKKGVTDFTYPYGYGGRGKRVRIYNIKNGNDNTTFTVYYYRASPPDSSALAPGLYELNHLDYYDIKPSGNESARLEVEVDTADYPRGVPFNTDALRLAHYTGGLWISEGGFSNSVFDYGVRAAGDISNFSPFALAAIREKVLEINTVYLQAHLQNNNEAYISWKALSSNANIALAMLQRSSVTDNKWADVKDITQAITAGNHTDKPLSRNTWLYRIKVRQHDGKVAYSNTEQVRAASSTAVKVYPTLTHSDVNISSDITDPLKLVEVYTTGGAKVVTYIPAGNQYRFNMGSLAAGVYKIKIFTATGFEVVSVVKY